MEDYNSLEMKFRELGNYYLLAKPKICINNALAEFWNDEYADIVEICKEDTNINYLLILTNHKRIIMSYEKKLESNSIFEKYDHYTRIILIENIDTNRCRIIETKQKKLFAPKYYKIIIEGANKRFYNNSFTLNSDTSASIVVKSEKQANFILEHILKNSKS